MRDAGKREPEAVALALAAWWIALVAKIPFMEALTLIAGRYGVRPDSDKFDEAAAAGGLPYCRALDLYVDPATKARAEALHFSQAHLALRGT